MRPTPLQLKIAVVVVFFAAVGLSSIGLYRHFNKVSEPDAVAAACKRAAEHRKIHNGPLDEMTVDDAICQGSAKPN